MKKITVDQFCEGVESIYVEQPQYALGYDGRDNKCDCIGMVRGALKRKGVEASGLGGTNYAARKTIQELAKITGTADLKRGDVVLKVRDKDDKSMPLPERYRKGAKDYDAGWGETNFSHIGTVTSVYPLVITHMTSPTAKKDTSLGRWEYKGKLPWVDYDAAPAEEPEKEYVIVHADNGLPVKMREKPSTNCKTWWAVPCGSRVQLVEHGATWCRIIWAGQAGYMMTKFIKSGEQLFTVVIKHADKQTAEELVTVYGGEMTAE